MPTYTQAQQDSMAKLKASNALNAPPGSDNPIKSLYGKVVPGLDVSVIPQSTVRPTGTAFAPGQEQERARLAYEASLKTSAPPQGATNPATPPPTTPPPTTPPPTTPPAGTGTGTGSDIMSLYGVPQDQQPKDLYGAYGLTKPVDPTVDTKKYDDMITKYQPTYDQDAIQKQLNQELADIKSKYDIDRKNAEKKTEGERVSQISNLYSLGFVNPASSGLSSIGSASNDTLNQRMDQISSNEAAEMDIAKSKAYDRSTKEKDKALTFAQDERARVEKDAQDKYTRDRQSMLDQIDLVNGAVSAWQAGKTLSRQEKVDAQNNVSDLIKNFGTGLFEGMSAEDLASLEKASGYSEGSLTKSITKLKQAELLAKQSEKNKFTQETYGNDVYLVYPNQLDENGDPKKTLFMKGVASTTDQKDYEYAKSQGFVGTMLDYQRTQANLKAKAGGGGSSSAGTYFTRPKPDGSIGYYFGSPKSPQSAQELTADQYAKGDSGKVPETIDEDTAQFYLSTAQDSDGNINLSKIPAEVRTQVIKVAKDAGLFDESDAETSGILQKIGDWFNRPIDQSTIGG